MNRRGNIPIAAKIVWNSTIYRIKKREMANLVGSISIMAGLHYSTGEIMIRGIFAMLLNMAVYLVNDLIDVEIDLHGGKRQKRKVILLKENKKSALAAIIIIALILFIFCIAYNLSLFIPLAGGIGICWLYSAYTKNIPFVDVISMTIWAVAMVSTGVKLHSINGWLLAFQLGLYSSCFEMIQTMRDVNEDSRACIKTTAVFLGPKRSKLLLSILMLSASIYCYLFINKILSIISMFAIIIPLPENSTNPDSMQKYWNKIKAIYGLLWLAIIITVWHGRAPAGLLN